MIDVQNVKKVYVTNNTKKSSDNSLLTVNALDGVTTKILDGEFSAIAGPSGSGKTTLLNLIGALDSITQGHIFLDNEDIALMNAKQKTILRREKVGFIFQSYNLIPVLSAQENVELSLQMLKNLSREEIRERSFEILKEVGLDGMQDRKPMQLSGGQQQRISIARALVKKPSVILADEPTANLDSKNSELILELMEELNKKHNITCLFSTHDALVMQHVRRIIKLQDGKIIDQGLQVGKTQEAQI